MLITGIQSVFEPRGELVVANCEVLRDFESFSAFFTGFPNARDNVAHRRRVKNLITPRERARQKVLHSDARFRQVAGFPALR